MGDDDDVRAGLQLLTPSLAKLLIFVSRAIALQSLFVAAPFRTLRLHSRLCLFFVVCFSLRCVMSSGRKTRGNWQGWKKRGKEARLREKKVRVWRESTCSSSKWKMRKPHELLASDKPVIKTTGRLLSWIYAEIWAQSTATNVIAPYGICSFSPASSLMLYDFYATNWLRRFFRNSPP